jgi:GR25 family glycosyltransferase involved in LPS biosynthesis
MAYVGYYINLDRSVDRRDVMDAQLTRLRLTEQYRRFAAVDGSLIDAASTKLTAGELGCFMSHYQVLQQNRNSAVHLHLIEDDVVLAGCAAQVVNQIVTSATIDDYDLLFTDMALPVDFKFYREARIRFERQIRRPGNGAASTIQFNFFPYISCTASYLVNRRSIGLICDILAHELDRGASAPIDVVLRGKVTEGRLRAKCLFPFITSVQPGKFANTVVRDTRDQVSDLAVDLARHSFFVDCDQTATLRLAEQRLASPHADFHGRLLAVVLGFMTSDAFQQP